MLQMHTNTMVLIESTKVQNGQISKGSIGLLSQVLGTSYQAHVPVVTRLSLLERLHLSIFSPWIPLDPWGDNDEF